MTYLLDVNVLLALLDPSHVHHVPARAWFDTTGHRSWATCPITENGTLRILANPRYRNSPGSVTAVRSKLTAFTQLPGHSFWADSISILHATGLIAEYPLTPRQITDIYLLSLAVVNDAEFATLDRRIPSDAVLGGAACLHEIAIQ